MARFLVVIGLAFVAACAATPQEQIVALKTRPPWAGTFELGGSMRHVAEVTVAPEKGLTYHRIIDVLGASSSLTFPIVRATADRFEINVGEDAPDWPALARTYVYTSWGTIDFLVPEERMQEFCAYASDRANWKARGGPFPRRGLSLSWAESPNAPLPVPTVPAEYRKFIKAPQ